MLSEEHIRRVLQEHVDAENARDRRRVLATYVEQGAEFVDVPSGRTFREDDAIIGNYQNLWDGFPGLVRRIDRWTIGDDGNVVIELTLTGTHDGPYRGIPASGRKLELPIIAHFEFDEGSGRIKRETAYYDTRTFQRQLGLV
jgi:steroid delta-isomerase-like uncharacterized protein